MESDANSIVPTVPPAVGPAYYGTTAAASGLSPPTAVPRSLTQGLPEGDLLLPETGIVLPGDAGASLLQGRLPPATPDAPRRIAATTDIDYPAFFAEEASLAEASLLLNRLPAVPAPDDTE